MGLHREPRQGLLRSRPSSPKYHSAHTDNFVKFLFSFSTVTRLSSRITSGIKVELFDLFAPRMEPEEDPLEAARRQARKRPRESLNCKFTAADSEVQ
jgi:hypothetical protein